MNKWINVIALASWWYAESTSIREIFEGVLKRPSKMLEIERTVVLLVF